MPLNDVVNVQIIIQSSALTLPGFGVPLLASVHSNFAERLRYYTDLTGILDDGFTTSDRVYQMAQAIFGQNPKPPRVAIGRRDTPVAMVHTIRVDGNDDGTYTIQIDGQNADFAAVAQSATQIRDALVTTVNGLTPALGQTGVTAAPVGTTDLTLTADTAGIPFAVVLTSPTADDLNFVQNVDVTGNDAGEYTITIGSVLHSYTADGVVAASVIRDALVTAINAGSSGVAASPGTGDDLDLQRQSSAFTVVVSAPSNNLVLTGRTLNVGMAEDLAAITEEQPDWYMLLIEQRDDLTIRASADYIETVRRMFLAQSSDSNIPDTVFSSSNPQDIASSLKALSYARTGLVYASTDTNDVAAAWAGLQLPKVPASSTWKFKTPTGVLPEALTSTQRTNLRAKSANWLETVAGRNIMSEGTVAEGEFIDIIRGTDKLFQTIQANVFGALVKNEKVDFTNGGIALLGDGPVTAALDASVTDGLIATSRPNPQTGDEETPAYTVTVPNVADISAGDRENRVIPDTNPVSFEGTLAGAIHAVNIRGTLSV